MSKICPQCDPGPIRSGTHLTLNYCEDCRGFVIDLWGGR
jgi:hypothetical protein